jgi:hypothetical protein
LQEVNIFLAVNRARWGGGLVSHTQPRNSPNQKNKNRVDHSNYDDGKFRTATLTTVDSVVTVPVCVLILGFMLFGEEIQTFYHSSFIIGVAIQEFSFVEVVW